MEPYIEAIIEKRFKRRMSQAEVDRQAGLSRRTMHKFEKGQIRNITIIKKIAAFFDVIEIRFDDK